jgi:hypothetical protein
MYTELNRLYGKDPLQVVFKEENLFLDQLPFLQFHHFDSTKAKKGGYIHESLIGYANHQLLQKLCRPKSHLAIDCTFSVCPYGFYQLMVVMVRAFSLYLDFGC